MGKPTICIGENKGADQLCSNCEADQRLCFRYSDSTLQLPICKYTPVCICVRMRHLLTPSKICIPEYIYTRVFLAHANWTLYLRQLSYSLTCVNIILLNLRQYQVQGVERKNKRKYH